LAAEQLAAACGHHCPISARLAHHRDARLKCPALSHAALASVHAK
jgi:hypothetical protein